MGISIADTYYLKALGSYPYELDEMMENLNYALSYDPEHPEANCLMARFYTHYVPNYAVAEEYIRQALVTDPRNAKTYEVYALVLLYSESFERLKKVVAFASTLKESNVPYLMSLKALGYESQGKLKKARKLLEKAKANCIFNGTIDYINNHLTRIKKKMKR